MLAYTLVWFVDWSMSQCGITRASYVQDKKMEKQIMACGQKFFEIPIENIILEKE